MTSKYLLALFACGILALTSCESKKTGGGGADGEPDDPNGYTLDIADPEVGTPMRGSMLIDMKVTQSVSGKMSKNETKTMRDEFTFRETVLERSPGSRKPNRSTILIDKWESSQESFSDKGVRDRIVGKTIQAVKMGNEFQFTRPDGSPIDPNVKIYLNKMFTKLYESVGMSDFLPGKTVKRGDSWDISIAKLSKVTNDTGMMKMDEKLSKGTGKLVGVSTQDGRKYGRLEIKALMIPAEIAGMKMKEGGKIEVNYTLDACIDGTKHDVKVDGKIVSQMEFSIPQENVTVKIDMKGEIKMSAVEEGNGHPARKKSTASDADLGQRGRDPVKTEESSPDVQDAEAKEFRENKPVTPPTPNRPFPDTPVPPPTIKAPPKTSEPFEPTPKPLDSK